MAKTSRKVPIRLDVDQEEGKTKAQHAAELATTGLAPNAFVTTVFAQPSGMLLGEHLSDVHKALKAAVERTKSGSTDQADELLTAQAITLNQVFVEMLRRAALNMGDHLGATETYMRLALKAQSQCRATLESLSEIRNPRSVAFVRQANIAAGHQQVNNGMEQGGFNPEGPREETEISQNKVLEASINDVTRLDTRKTSQAGRGNPKMETMGAVHRPSHRRRQAGRGAQQLEGGRPTPPK